MKKYHEVQDVHFEGNDIVLKIDGEKKRFPLEKVSKRLLCANPDDRQTYEVSPSGYGIHWPSIDEDISIDGLLGIIHCRKAKSKAAFV
ncbi:MAG: DUF2442 domain-containing protein [Nitrospinae bacterium]|nr:DUF2442 domain-containing protein [Nitrospinota bacterium]